MIGLRKGEGWLQHFIFIISHTWTYANLIMGVKLSFVINSSYYVNEP